MGEDTTNICNAIVVCGFLVELSATRDQQLDHDTQYIADKRYSSGNLGLPVPGPCTYHTALEALLRAIFVSATLTCVQKRIRPLYWGVKPLHRTRLAIR